MAPPSMDKHGMAEQITGVPIVVLICPDCGFMRLFSAMVMGLFPELSSSN